MIRKTTSTCNVEAVNILERAHQQQITAAVKAVIAYNQFLNTLSKAKRPAT
ncbi:MAG: hypothetical protein ACFBSC_22545 [Microcoleaceae cyanobacterium]